MMPKLRSVLLATALLAAPLAATPALAQAAAPASAAQSEHDKLFALFARSDEESLKRNPLNALFRGDMRYADRLGDFLTDAYNDAERQAAESELADLAKIDRAKLSATDRIAYDVFKYDRESTLKGLTPEILALTQTRPMNHFFGFPVRWSNASCVRKKFRSVLYEESTKICNGPGMRGLRPRYTHDSLLSRTKIVVTL